MQPGSPTVWVFEKPILVCPNAPADRFVSAGGLLITIAVHERSQNEPGRSRIEDEWDADGDLRAVSGA
jgi:hypothetical protein